ncbi:MAG TPA: carboxypeptidase-like regulatory domain-containing protein, partial [Pirellulales bacterium]
MATRWDEHRTLELFAGVRRLKYGPSPLKSVTPADLETVLVENRAISAQSAGLPADDRDKIVLLSLASVGRLTGQLIAANPRAVAHRKLRFATWQIPGDEHAGGGLAEVVTDDDGKFVVPAIAAGSLSFETTEDGPPGPSPKDVTAWKGHPPERPVHLASQTTGPPIDAGKTTTFDIPLRRAVRVIQEVRDEENDAPLADVAINVTSWLYGAATGGQTNASGRLSFHVLPGAVWVAPIRVPAGYYHPNGGRISSTDVADTSDAVSLSVVKLIRGVPLDGRVVDAKMNPLAGAEVAGFWKSPQNSLIAVRTWSNARGEFTIDAVAPQTPVTLWARHGDLTSVEPVSAQPGGRPLVLTVGKKPGISLEGRVIDDAGRPIARAAVRVAMSQSRFIDYVLFDGHDRLLTDAQGRFQTPACLRPNATYSVEVTAPGLLSCRSELIEPESWHTTRFADVVLHRAPRLRVLQGRVLDRAGRAVAGATVWQSGNGPRRTETTADAEGRFQLSGIYDIPALVFARKEGFRLRGTPIAATDKACQITLHGDDEPSAPMVTLPPALTIEDERELALSLIEPSLPMLRDPTLTVVHNHLLRTLARVDPAAALETADALADPFYVTAAQTEAVRTLLTTDFEQGLAALARLDGPIYRVQECAFACYELFDAPPERRGKLLDVALAQAREAGPTQSGRHDAALTAAALLPIAEKIDPTLVEGYFWRALSWRGPWPAPGDFPRNYNMRLTCLAALIARYDRTIARDLLAPLAARLREAPAEGGVSMMGLALADPRWAAELVAALPDTPAPPGKGPKLAAARWLAECLVLPRQGHWGTWDRVYRKCYLRDP